MRFEHNFNIEDRVAFFYRNKWHFGIIIDMGWSGEVEKCLYDIDILSEPHFGFRKVNVPEEVLREFKPRREI
jgi:hypothetical protein